MNSKILIIGVTASGKSRLSFELAQKLDTDIISVDSMKVYRRMDVGTAKPPKETRELVKYHLIDIREPSKAFSVAEFLEETDKAICEIRSKGKPILAAGGTAMYVKALISGLFEGPGTDAEIREQLRQELKDKGLMKLHEQLQSVDSQAAQRIHPNDEKRIIRALEVFQITGKPISSFQNQWETNEDTNGWTIVGVRREKEQESKRINARVKKMIEMGLFEEVEQLLNEPKPLSKQAAAAIGYAEIIDYLQGNLSKEQAIEKIKINTRRLAKHQRTWFKRFPGVKWFEIDKNLQKNDEIFDFVKKAMQH